MNFITKIKGTQNKNIKMNRRFTKTQKILENKHIKMYVKYAFDFLLLSALIQFHSKCWYSDHFGRLDFGGNCGCGHCSGCGEGTGRCRIGCRTQIVQCIRRGNCTGNDQTLTAKIETLS